MSTTYEMSAGAVIDAEGRTVVNGVVSIYYTLTGGTPVPPATLRQSDGSAWPIEGVKTDGNGAVRVQWPDASGDAPDVLYADSARGRWIMPPIDLSTRLKALEEGGVGGAAQLNERGDYTNGASYAIADVFTYNGGRYAVAEAFTAGPTPDLDNTIFLGADASAVPVTVDEDEDADTGTVAFLLPSGKYLIYTGARSDGDGGGGSFSEADVTNEWGHANVPHTITNWTATKGTVVGGYGNDLATPNAWAATGYDPAAFGGTGGFTLQNDGLAAHLAAPVSLDPGDDWGAAYVVMDDWGIDASDIDGTNRIILALQNAARSFQVRVLWRLHNDGTTKTYSWVVQASGQSDLVVPVGALAGLNGPSQVVEAPTSIALHYKGSASYLAVNGTQMGATINLTGLSAEWLDINPHSGESALFRGYGTYWSWGWTTAGMPETDTKAWVADRLAAAVAA